MMAKMLVQRQCPASAPAYWHQCARLASQPFSYLYSFYLNPQPPVTTAAKSTSRILTQMRHHFQVSSFLFLLLSFINTIHCAPSAPSVSQWQWQWLAALIGQDHAGDTGMCALHHEIYGNHKFFVCLLLLCLPQWPDVCCRVSTWQECFFQRQRLRLPTIVQSYTCWWRTSVIKCFCTFSQTCRLTANLESTLIAYKTPSKPLHIHRSLLLMNDLFLSPPHCLWYAWLHFFSFCPVSSSV